MGHDLIRITEEVTKSHTDGAEIRAERVNKSGLDNFPLRAKGWEIASSCAILTMSGEKDPKLEEKTH